jgi:glycosyltransferase involved in cell wall biosynthesis
VSRKKVLIQTDFSLVKTGFGRSAKALLSYLYKTNKYDLVHFCVGMNEASPALLQTPWKSVGTLPSSPEKLDQINKDPKLSKIAHYGAYYLDEIIEREKPDVYIAAQDIWGVDFAVGKHWFNKINSAIWTTLDSLPLLPTAVELAPEIKNYWMWSSFATEEMHRLGHKHVKTVHGIIDTDNFKRLKDEERKLLRKRNNIEEDAFVIGFVFRNQLRKSAPNLIEGFKKFKDKNPHIKNAKLLLHTSYQEGWDLRALADEYKVNWEDILTTVICAKCKKYEVKSFKRPNDECRFCGTKGSVNTTGVALGVSEIELNEVYNLMDVYCHPFTSGGQEIPIQEAKLTELPTLVTSYSCGQEMCGKAANSLSLNWTEYREFGTSFIKATTDPNHIAERLEEVYNMPDSERQRMGKAARNWTLQNFSVQSVGKEIEKFIDSCKKIKESEYPKPEKKDPYAKIENIPNAVDWLKALYKNILKTTVTSKDEGLQYWLTELSKGAKAEQIEQYFRDVASQDNQKASDKLLKDKLSDNKNRILYIMPLDEVDIFVSTSLFKSIKDLYPDHDLYVASQPKNELILAANQYVHKFLKYEQAFEHLHLLKDDQGDDLFEAIYTPHLNKNNYNLIHKTNL